MIIATVLERAVITNVAAPGAPWEGTSALVRISDGEVVAYIPQALWLAWGQYREECAETLLQMVREASQ